MNTTTYSSHDVKKIQGIYKAFDFNFYFHIVSGM